MLSLKDNQSHLFEDMRRLFADLEESQYKAYAFDYEKTVNKNHERIEIRGCWTLSDPQVLRKWRSFDNWENLLAVLPVSAEPNESDRLCASWGIENELHWTLDIAFDEDRCCICKDNGTENFAILRHMALNFLKQEKTCKQGIKAKRLLSAWKTDYLLKVLAGLALLQN